MAAELQQENKLAKLIGNFLVSRLSLADLQHLAAKKKVPVHKHSLWYYMGGITMIYFAVQVVTGILLMVYYVPEINAAHASILKINSQIDFGWFIRSLHSWGSTLMILSAAVHLFSSFFMRAYRQPREITWWAGLVLMILCLAFGFTGYLLPWDDLSFFATKVGLDITAKAPLVGGLLGPLLKGGNMISQATISRFFGIHVAILPLTLISLLAVHLMLVQSHGMSEPAAFADTPPEKRRYEPFFPDFFFKDMLVWILALNVLFVLVVLFPWGVGPEANPFAPAPIGIKPEWYFLGAFQFLKLIPPMVGPIEGELFGILAMSLVGLGFLIMPFIDNGSQRRRALLATIYGVAVVLGLIFLSIWGALS